MTSHISQNKLFHEMKSDMMEIREEAKPTELPYAFHCTCKTIFILIWLLLYKLLRLSGQRNCYVRDDDCRLPLVINPRHSDLRLYRQLRWTSRFPLTLQTTSPAS